VQLSAGPSSGTYQRAVGVSAMAHRCLIYAQASFN
jgi:hypothetical protein